MHVCFDYYCCNYFHFPNITVLRVDQQQRVTVGDVSLDKLNFLFQQEQSVGSGYHHHHQKWLAPESIEDGEFSEKSDVVCTTAFKFFKFACCLLILVVIWCDSMGNIQLWQSSIQ